MSRPSMRPDSTPRPEREPDGLDPVLKRQQQLAAELRQMFAHVAEGPVSQEFLELLKRLDEESEIS